VNHAWLTLNAATGELTGTPTATGNTEITVKAVDDANPLDTAQMTFHIEIKNVAITTATLLGAYQDLAYSQTVAAMGGATPYAWSLRPGGENYAWLGIDALTGELTGTPTSAELGEVKVIVRVDDNGGNYDIRLFTFSVRIYDPPVIAATTLPDGLANEAYSAFVPVTGGAGTLTYSITSGLNHDWLVIDTASGELTGTPDLSEAGAVTITVKVEETDNPTVFVEGTFGFTVLGIEITTALLPDIATGGTYGMTIEAKGGSGYYAWSVNDGASSNHGWLTLDLDHGTLTGPAPGTVQEVVLAVDVEDSLDPTLTHSATFRFFVVGLVFTEDFEAGNPPGWSANGNWAVGTLLSTAIGPGAAYQGSSVAATTVQNFYTAGWAWGNCDLETAGILLPATTNGLYLVYYQWCDFQPDDGGIIEVHDGATWSQVTPTGTYPAGKVDAAGLNLDGFTSRAARWHRVIVDLSSLQGNTIMVRWSFFSDATTNGPGWYIDDVRIVEISSTALPAKTTNPYPYDGITYAPAEAGDYASGLTLHWDASIVASGGYELFAGTNPTDVANATSPASPEYLGAGPTPFFTDIAATFSAGNTYYWRVDALNANGTTKGDVWAFTATSPAKVVINEANTYEYVAGAWSLTHFVEVFNFNGIHQDISGWQVTLYDSGALLGTYTFPDRTLLAPNAGTYFVGSSRSRMTFTGITTQSMAHVCPFIITWADAFDEGEVILTDRSGDGMDYLGFNVVTSHLPADLAWMGALSSPYYYYGNYYRTSTLDSDSASDWSAQNYWNGSTPGFKNQGQ
jgi:hypothetical protein